MPRNPILDELHAIRDRMLADAGGDLHKLLARLREREAVSGRLLSQEDESGAGLAPGLSNGCSGPAARAAEPRR
jgi:hypothetical protein